MINKNKKKKIAWGTSKLLELYLTKTGTNPFSYYIDDFSNNENPLYKMPLKKSDALLKEKRGFFQIVIFAMSSRSLQQITLKLNSFGLAYGKDFIYYSDFFYEGFVRKAENFLKLKLNPKIYRFANSFTLNSRVLMSTSIPGTWLFLELLDHLDKTQGAIAEVGAFQGGNALCALNFMAKLNAKKYYIFDSFEGFPELSKSDPKQFHKGDHKIETSFQEIQDAFAIFPEARIIKGFIPGTFIKIPKAEKFSLIFYDCDLYQPALDTFNFLWDRIVPGGYLLIHDYETEKGGFTGVKKATDEFFKSKKIDFVSFFENTMAVIKKQ